MNIDYDSVLAIVLDYPPKKSHLMERFITFCEHLGYLVGGGWNNKDGKADFFLDAHDCNCGTLPQKDKILKEDLERIHDWCKDRDVVIDQVMTMKDYEDYLDQDELSAAEGLINKLGLGKENDKS